MRNQPKVTRLPSKIWLQTFFFLMSLDWFDMESLIIIIHYITYEDSQVDDSIIEKKKMFYTAPRDRLLHLTRRVSQP